MAHWLIIILADSLFLRKIVISANAILTTLVECYLVMVSIVS